MPLWSLPAIKMSWYFLLELQLNFITVEYLRIISWTRHWFKTAVKDIRFCSAIYLIKSDFSLHQLNCNSWIHSEQTCLTPSEADLWWTPQNPTDQKSQDSALGLQPFISTMCRLYSAFSFLWPSFAETLVMYGRDYISDHMGRSEL